MKSRHAALAVATLAVAVSAVVFAQSPAPAADGDAARVQAVRERIRADVKALVAKNMTLTEAEAKAFWPAYDQCHKEIDAAHKKENRALLDYINGASTLNDLQAKKLVNDLLEAEGEGDKARRKCFDRVAKVLPGRKAARYLQIENKIRAVQRFDAAVAVPLVP